MDELLFEIESLIKIVSVKEEIFRILKFEKQTGDGIGELEVATEEENLPDKWTKEQNLPDKWNKAYYILRKANATIQDRYYNDWYEYGYWLYNNKIYRQERKERKLREPNYMKNIKNKFPQDLRNLLRFTVKDHDIIITPTAYLAPENLPKISDIIKQQGGDYVKTSKESHFKVPFKRETSSVESPKTF